jgi:hypothetical protein
MATRKTLAMMSALEVTEHYKRLAELRKERARLDWQAAVKSKRTALIRAAERRLERAFRLAMPRSPWQLDAALERKEQYSVKVAAGFMAANGWSLEAARYVLLGA